MNDGFWQAVDGMQEPSVTNTLGDSWHWLKPFKKVEKYLADVRPSLVVEPDGGYVFLTMYGDPLSVSWLTDRVREYVEQSGVGKRAPAILSGTLWPLSCSRVAPISASSRRCSATPTPRPRRSTRSFRSRSSKPSTPPHIRGPAWRGLQRPLGSSP